ncbi:MBL fold metallo-hydrolase [Arsenicicoccus sp. oral taxon 190]|uniref:MBL fold metallo-hydrolase n=1 Tax=Arsenicicoccus sp. oral taxon 190 TaxID=1658671 RepID=UPI00067A363F|nr:MBL fold metallo-hydrolase [Arsenicicoccus sp. oral taxon 190]AKT50469.1 beta-lactamase [Arsenicicoccus sp. oral taxon 190]
MTAPGARLAPPPPTATPWLGGAVTERATCVLAPNPGPMTLDGTNTWLLSEPGSEQVAVVDPGPLDEAHLQAVLAAATARGARVTHTLLTHGHPDHAEGAARFAELTGTTVRAIGSGPQDLHEGSVIRVGELEVVVLATPGHTGDSVSFVVAADNAVLTGDTLLGRGTTVVAHPDGVLEDYLASLRRLRSLTGSGAVTRILPGHGPTVTAADHAVAYYLQHRADRLDQVRSALAAGDTTADEVVARVYADVPREVWPAARLSVLAQLGYLERGQRARR